MASPGSLEKATTVKFTEGQIVMILQSPKLTHPLVLVEGEEDCIFYKRFLSAQSIVPVNDKGKGGWHVVADMTRRLHERFKMCNVIGIRDRDYTLYDTSYENTSEWVVCSDGHSLECMLLKSQNVRNELLRQCPRLRHEWAGAIRACRYIAQYYIFDIVCSLKLSFKNNKMHLINYFDARVRRMKESWEERLDEDFLKAYPEYIKDEMGKKLLPLGLDKVNDWDIVRGHDVVDVCYEIGKSGGLEKKELVRLMINAYSTEDFLSTTVATTLKRIECKRNIQLIATQTN